MSGATIINAAPRSILQGIRDVSGRAPVYESEQLPTHLPHVYLFAERGPTLPQLVVGDSMVKMYGRRTFDYRGPYANHQTVLANTVNAEGNQLMVQRVRPVDANAPATLRLSVDVMSEVIPQYERDIDGKFVLDANGQKIPTGDKVPGYVYRWFVERVGEEDLGMATATTSGTGEVVRITEDSELRITEDGSTRIIDNELGTATTTQGTMVNAEGAQSTIYPILELEVQDFGAYGNNIGMRLSAPTTDSPVPIDDTTMLEQLAYLYRIQLVERPDNASTPVVLETLQGEQFLNFSFKENVINPRTDQELSFDTTFMAAWNQEASGGYPQVRGPIGNYHIYREYLEEVLAEAQVAESTYGTVPADIDAMHLLNVFTGHDQNAVPYYALQVRGPAHNGILLTANSTHYCRGGSDGTMTFATFDAEVGRQLEYYGELEADLLDTAYYPQSAYYDTGFSLETKKKFGVPLGRRKDVYVVVSTQDVSQRQNTPSEETSIATALRTALRMYPESEIYGTSTCRALVLGHSGYLVNSSYKGLLPLSIEFAQKCARYMGAGTGIWQSGLGFDVPGNNRVSMFRGVNAPFKQATVRNRDWDIGLVWVQNYDRRSLFWPAFQTVYDDDSSVLNAALNMMVAVELEKVADRTWRDLTGISYLTTGQFIERSNRLIRERTLKRFDGRVIIEPDTFLTANDEQRGYSWSCNIHMYAPNMKTVGTFTIVAHRREDANS